MKLDPRLPWLWAVILAFMVTQSSPKNLPQMPPITDPKFIEECVNIHNELRAQVQPTAGNIRYMTWDAALAKTARAWTNKCVFKHNFHINEKYATHPTFKSVGENIWMGTPSNYVVRNATTSWFNEVKYYNLDDNSCARQCGHYTQVVWASTYKVGCALKLCPNLGQRTVIFLCNYSPGGNMIGMRPYLKGKPCSLCVDEDTCQNNYCRNPSRDKILSYPYWNPKWEFPRRITCNPFCQICVSFRLAGIVLATISVYVLQRKYPHLNLLT